MTNQNWTEYWNAKNADYLARHPEVKDVLEHRNIDGGEIYAVALKGDDGFEVRYYVAGVIFRQMSFSSRSEAIAAYRALRDELVHGRSLVKASKTAGEERYDPEKDLARLKDFQMKSADAAFKRLYLDRDATDRFLIADEAGLGKTLVAKGLLAKAVEHLWDSIRRIDIVYICSNAAIAKQNIARLRLSIEGSKDTTFSSRLTLIPTQIEELEKHKVNFISFTPGTSFNLRSSGGMSEERVVLYFMLKAIWKFDYSPKFMNILECGMRRENFRNRIRWYPKDRQKRLRQNKLLLASFKERLGKEMRHEFFEMAESFKGRKHIDWGLNHQRNKLVGRLRHILAESTLEYLEPDIVVLDEFQRFKDILDEESETGKLASQLFRYQDEHSDTHVKVVLLSATPFKMYTISEERADDDHYTDFISTLSFLLDGEEKTREIDRLLSEYRDALYRVKSIADTEEIKRAKDRLQVKLQKVMTRTERYKAIGAGEGLIKDKLHDEVAQAEDIRQYAALSNIAKRIRADRPLEFWKSAPYMLNFMDDYKIKKRFTSAVKSKANPVIARGRSMDIFLKRESIERWNQVDSPNAKLRVLIERAVKEHEAHQHLWIPPALSYYKPFGRYEKTAGMPYTKTLIFSSWKMVPKVISMLASYEVERLMSGDPPEKYGEIGPRALLRFNLKDGQPQSMASLAIIFPALSLALSFDPAEYCARNGGSVSFEEMHAAAREAVEETIISLRPSTDEEFVEDEALDQLWAYLARFDAAFGKARWTAKGDGWPALRWLQGNTDAETWHSGRDIEGDDSERGFPAHVEAFREEYLRYEERLPRPDPTTLDALANICIGSPAVTALRSLMRQIPARPDPGDYEHAISAAAAIAHGFRSMFNRRWNLRFLRAEDPFWERVLEYCCEGNLQSVMDEYVHLVTDLEGMFDKPADEKLKDLSDVICSALYLRAANPKFDAYKRNVAGMLRQDGSMSIRTHFALRFGDETEVTELLDGNRTDVLRTAFNSPFRPFIFATTSIGQEGLDFHGYCHSIFHWNLPGNPVDLEQREGRINRYKGHLIRKNLVLDASTDYMKENFEAGRDPWELLFEAACLERDPEQSELVPFWVYECPDGCQIERHLPLFPFSRERNQFEALKRSLMFYRMAFGQPRQQDLVEYLKTVLVEEPDEKIEGFVSDFMIDLGPA